MPNCIKCRAELPENANFCPSCGKKQTPQKQRAPRRGNGTGSVYKRGKTWEAAVVLGYKIVDGKAVPIRVTKGGFKTKKEAAEYIPTLRQERPKLTPTLNDLYYGFINSKQFDKLSDSRKEKYAIAWKKIEHETYNRIDLLTVADLQHLVDSHTSSFYPARDVRDLLSKLYQRALPDQYVSINLAEYIELPDKNEKEREPFSKEDITKLWDDYYAGNTFSGYILLMCYTGMMPGELMCALKSQIDWEGKQIRGAGKKTKVRKETPLVLADCIVPVLADLCEHSPSDKIITINKDKFYENYYNTLTRAGCKRLPPYAARHAAATTLALENIPLSTVQRVMRHSSITTTQRYVHIDATAMLEAVNRLQRPE